MWQAAGRMQGTCRRHLCFVVKRGSRKPASPSNLSHHPTCHLWEPLLSGTGLWVVCALSRTLFLLMPGLCSESLDYKAFPLPCEWSRKRVVIVPRKGKNEEEDVDQGCRFERGSGRGLGSQRLGSHFRGVGGAHSARPRTSPP